MSKHRKACSCDECTVDPRDSEITALRSTLATRDAEIARLREALRVIELGLAADQHEPGEFYTARAWLELHGQYAGDLGDGMRVLLEVARAALQREPQK